MISFRTVLAALALVLLPSLAAAQAFNGQVDKAPNLTLSKILGVDSSGRVGLSAMPASPLVGTTDTQTLVNKTLTSPFINTINGNALPSGPIVGTTDAQTLTNKSFAAGSVLPNASFQDVIKDTALLRAFCFKGTGASTTLSSVSSCGGLPTIGWSLAQWRSFLPAATALTDQIDWVAIQSAINATSATEVQITIPGKAVINKPIVTACGKQVSFSGLDQQTSQVTQITVGANGFEHCQSGTPGSLDTFHMKDLSIFCGASSCGDMIRANAANAGSGSLNISNVSASTTASGIRWANGFVFTGTGATYISNVTLSLGTGALITGNCMQFTSGPAFTVLLQLRDIHVFACGVGFNIQNDGTNHGLEGVYMDTVNADQVIDFVHIGNSIAGYAPPEYTFRAIQASFFRSLFSMTGTNPVAGDITVDSSWFIQLAPSTPLTGTITPASGIFDFGASQRVTLTKNSFVQSSGATFNYLMNIASGASDYTIEDNFVPVLLGTINNGIIHINSGVKNLLEQNNDFAYAGSRVVNDAATDASVLSNTYLVDISGGKCSGVLNRRGTLSNRQITCSDTVTGTTNGAGSLIVTYPYAGWSSNPANVVSSNGDVSVCAGPISPSSYSSTGFTASTQSGACAGAPIRVNYYVTGH